MINIGGYDMQDFDTWNNRIKTIHPKANSTVLQFIYDFLTLQNNSEEILYRQFSSGYCYYFAHMLESAFKRGTVCWAAPYGHIVWVDENGIPYDISGVHDSDCVDYIPESFMDESINDFKHIKGQEHNTSEQEIAKMIIDWQESSSS